MAAKCCHCKQRSAEYYGEIEFEYREMQFKTIRWGASCTECAKKNSIEQFENVPKGVIEPVPGTLPKICWRKYLGIDSGDLEYHGGPRDQATHVLQELEILVYPETVDECWQVIGCGMNLGPLNPGYGGMSFAREDDARLYASAKYSRAMYQVNVGRWSK